MSGKYWKGSPRVDPTRGIAGAMFIGEGTVEKHVQHLFQKLDIPVGLGVNRRVLAVLAWLEYRSDLARHESELIGEAS